MSTNDDNSAAAVASVDDDTVTVGSGNVFADLGLPNADERLLKSRIAIVISDAIEQLGLSQTAAAERLGIAQPDVSNVLRGRLRGYSLERLLSFARALGNDIDITVRQHDPEQGGRLRVMVGKDFVLSRPRPDRVVLEIAGTARPLDNRKGVKTAARRREDQRRA
jgi:predicted XRE-type DNA-binding protein